MDDKEQKVITFKLSVEETEALDARATHAGMSRSDYLRMVLFAPAEAPSADLEPILRHLIYIANRTHTAVYSIAETAGTLSSDQLQEIHDACRLEGLRYVSDLPQCMAKVQAQITAQTNTAPPAAEKGKA